MTPAASPIHVKPEVACDWVLRTLLPQLLLLCGHDGHARVTSAHGPITSSATLRDPYSVGRIAATLRDIRSELIGELQTERGWLKSSRNEETLVRFGGRRRFRAMFFPHLDEITEYVAATAVARGFGVLLRTCVELTIELIVTRGDNLSGRAGADISPLMQAYDAALSALVERGKRAT